MSPTRQLTPSESHRLVQVRSVELLPGITSGSWVLVVRGIAPCANMQVTVEPVVYIRQPEYWRLEVVGTLPGGICLPALKEYTAALPLAGVLGTRGIEVVGQDFTERLDVPPPVADGPRVFQVGSVTTAILESAPPQLRVSATGTASTPGWTDARLEAVGDAPGADGYMEFEFVADPPEGIVAQVLAPIVASTTWRGYGQHEGETVGVRVLARTNEVEALIRPPAPSPGFQDWVTLSKGTPQQVDGGALTLELIDVADSRCPSNVLCVWEGRATVTVEVRPRGGGSVRVTLSSGQAEPTEAIDGYLLRLVDLLPYPMVGPVPSQEYRAALVVLRP